jgi:hypothetical protein
MTENRGKKVRLRPLSFEEALRGAMQVDPTKIKKPAKRKKN